MKAVIPRLKELSPTERVLYARILNEMTFRYGGRGEVARGIIWQVRKFYVEREAAQS